MKEISKENDYYTLGIWNVKPGKENEFVKSWISFAELTSKKYPGSGQPHLLKDENDPLRFISFGPWDSVNTIQDWRSSKEFKNFAEKVRELCSDFQPNMLKEIYK